MISDGEKNFMSSDAVGRIFHVFHKTVATGAGVKPIVLGTVAMLLALLMIQVEGCRSEIAFLKEERWID